MSVKRKNSKDGSSVSSVSNGKLRSPEKKKFFMNECCSLYSQPFLLFVKHQICSASCEVFEWTLVELLLDIMKNLLYLFFLMDLFILCVIFKSVWYARHFEKSCMQCSCMYDWKQTAQRIKLRKRLLTIIKRNIFRWNIYSDNNFHSRTQVLRVKCPWQSWVFKHISLKPCRFKLMF